MQATRGASVSIQIESIILYNHAGEVRKLDFKVGAVNIITGRSNRGKSAIIPIIEYCLGNSEFEVPGDAIKRTVAYYCVVFRIDNERILVAKPPPSKGNRRQNRGTYVLNPPTIPLSFDELTARSNDDEIRRHIGSLLRQALGIDHQISLQRSIERSRYFLFQKSTTILHDRLLFHRQESDAHLISESLPFFLGIREEEDIALARSLDEANKAGDRARRKLNDARRRLADLIQQGQNLIQEMATIGLLNAESWGTDTPEVPVIVGLLRGAILQWQPGQVPSIADQRLPNLQNQLKAAKERFSRIQMRIQATRSLQQDAAGYSEQMEDQRMRLQSIDVISPQNPFEFADSIATCPLCNSPLDNSSIDVPRISAIRSSLEKLDKDLAGVLRDQPEWAEVIGVLEEEGISEKQEIDRIQIEVTRVLRDNQAQENILQEIVNANSKAERLIGRAEYFLELIQTERLDELEFELTQAEANRDAIQKSIDSNNLMETSRRVLNSVSEQMTAWSTDLDFSYTGRFLLDIDKLTVIVDTDDSSIPMYQLGGNPNILGCHLLALLALHKHFIEHKQPVPGFLVLDQPVQGYFPSTNDHENVTLESIQVRSQDSEIEAATRIFDFLFRVNHELAPNMQIIVLEHALLDNEKFRQALVGNETWFDEDGLIPQEWIHNIGRSPEQATLFD